MTIGAAGAAPPHPRSRAGAPTGVGVPQLTPAFGDHAARTRVVESRAVRHAAQTVSPRPAAPTKLPRQASVSSGQRRGATGARMTGMPSANAIVAPGATTAGTRRSGSHAMGKAGGAAQPASTSSARQRAPRTADGRVGAARRCMRRAL
jgi:hypothetical protein